MPIVLHSIARPLEGVQSANIAPPIGKQYKVLDAPEPGSIRTTGGIFVANKTPIGADTGLTFRFLLKGCPGFPDLELGVFNLNAEIGNQYALPMIPHGESIWLEILAATGSAWLDGSVVNYIIQGSGDGIMLMTKALVLDEFVTILPSPEAGKIDTALFFATGNLFITNTGDDDADFRTEYVDTNTGVVLPGQQQTVLAHSTTAFSGSQVPLIEGTFIRAKQLSGTDGAVVFRQGAYEYPDPGISP